MKERERVKNCEIEIFRESVKKVRENGRKKKREEGGREREGRKEKLAKKRKKEKYEREGRIK
jgi:hypothetical protein